MGPESFKINSNEKPSSENEELISSDNLEEIDNTLNSESNEVLGSNWRFEKAVASVRLDEKKREVILRLEELRKEKTEKKYEELSVLEKRAVLREIVREINEDVGKGDLPEDNSLRFVAEIVGEELYVLEK